MSKKLSVKKRNRSIEVTASSSESGSLISLHLEESEPSCADAGTESESARKKNKQTHLHQAPANHTSSAPTAPPSIVTSASDDPLVPEFSSSSSAGPDIPRTLQHPYGAQIDEWITGVTIRKLLKQSQMACVFINFKDAVEGIEEQGSGVVIRDSGILLTAAHCTAEVGSTRDAQTIDGTKYIARTIHVSPTHDLALMQLLSFPAKNQPPSQFKFPVAPVASIPFKKGDACMAIGQPLLMRRTARRGDERLKCEYGKITIVPRDPLYVEEDMRGILSHTCNTTAGHSGCPIFNMRGEVAAIHVTCDDHQQTAVTLEAILQFIQQSKV